MTDLLLESLYFMVPAYLANMAPVLVAKIPFLKGFSRPLHVQLFGQNKTYRGLLAAVLFGALAAAMQKALAVPLASISLVPFELWPYAFALLFGGVFGFGAIAGDALKSFFKRRIGIAPGRPWPVFDQLDFVIGGMAAASLFFVPSNAHIATIVIATPILHLASNVIAHILGMKKVWW